MVVDGAAAMIDAERVSRLRARFLDRFGATPQIYRAPGRVNLIGEHTDYNEGFVMPAAIALSCWTAAAPRDDNRIVVSSEARRGQVTWRLDEEDPSPGPAWSNYVIGVAAVLRRAGHRLRGATLLVDSDVPPGAGLSSSAALEVSAALALLDLAGVRMAATDIARICQRAEIEIVGTRCGIMDQYVACHARSGHALLLDCRSIEHRDVRLPSGVRLVACNTMVRHRHASGEYNRRRAECETGVAVIAAHAPQVRSLRDVDPARLDAVRGGLSDVVFRRCRHVVTENARVIEASNAIEREDYDAIGVLMAESHRSLREDYEVSCPELDAMVALAREVPGVYGARMTGGGFGGCTVNLVHVDAVTEFTRHVAAGYEAGFGRSPEIYVTDAGEGAGRISS